MFITLFSNFLWKPKKENKTQQNKKNNKTTHAQKEKTKHKMKTKQINNKKQEGKQIVSSINKNSK